MIKTNSISNEEGSAPPKVVGGEFPLARVTVKHQPGAYEVGDSFNISSVVDAGKGKLEVNLATLSDNPDYTLSVSLQTGVAGATAFIDPDTDPTSESFRVLSQYVPAAPIPQIATPVEFKRLYITVHGQRIE